MNLALGIRLFLIDAVYRHRRQNKALPRRLVLHPTSSADLVRDAPPGDWMYARTAPPDVATWCGIPVGIDAYGRTPKLESTQGVIEYL